MFFKYHIVLLFIYLHCTSLAVLMKYGENTGKIKQENAMATINLILKKDTGTSNLYARFRNGKMDFSRKTNIVIDSKYWDKKKQRLRKTKSTPEADKINNTLSNLRSGLLSSFSLDYANGIDINADWLEKSIKKCLGRPQNEIHNVKDHTSIYFVDFINWWCQSKAPEYRNPRSRKKITDRTIGYYKLYAQKLIEFEKSKGAKIKIADLNREKSEKIMIFFDETLEYSPKTVAKWVSRHNFLCDRAIEEGKIIPRDYKCIYIANEKKEVLHPYLDESEILKIFKYDFSGNERLDNARDNLIIGLNTGLRVSDFLGRLKTDNISNDYIEIETKKTKTKVAIPVNWMIRETLNKRLGFLPSKISDQKFNKYIKEICEIVGINQEMEGYLSVKRDGKYRNKLGVYPKYALVSSHICRRSFATNLFGKVPNSVIMAICGWSGERMMLNYIKKTNMESAQQLKKYWDEKEKELNLKSK